jgi:hypothetical protein
MNDCVLRNDTELGRIHLDDLELYLPHATAGCEGVTLSDGSVCFPKVGCEEHVE